MARVNGFILYRGPSMLDGSPIVAIVTGTAGASANAKTGAMLQTWILCADVDPFDATKSGADAAVCGDCPQRPSVGGACYVRVYQAPKAVYRAWTRGRYPLADVAHLVGIGDGRAVRIGSYGDPAAVPSIYWRALLRNAASHTGYTHQWRRPVAAALRGIVMASADSEQDMRDARAAGWRTFRMRTAGQALAERESVCPASAEAGHKVACADCGACNGAAGGRKGSIAIVAHGALAVRFARSQVSA